MIYLIFLLSSQDLNKVNLLIKEGRYSEAEKRVDSLLRIYPAEPVLYFTRSIIYSLKGNTSKEKEYLAVALTLEPNNYIYHREMADVFVKEKDFKRAREEILKSLSLGEDSADAFVRLSKIFYEEGEIDSSYLYFTKIDKRGKHNKVDYYLVGALIYSRLDSLDKARKILERGLKFYPDDYLLNITYLRLLLARAENKKALRKIRSLKKIYPDSAEIDVIQAKVYLSMHKEKRAFQILNSLLDKEIGFSQVYILLGDMYMNQDSVEKAIEVYKKGIEKASDKLLPFKIGLAYMKKEEYRRALSYFTMALYQDREFVEAYINRGIANYNLRRYKQAMLDLSYAIFLDSLSKEAYLNRGNVLGELEKYDYAFADVNRSIEIDSNYSLAYFNRGILYYEMGLYNDAIGDFNRAMTMGIVDDEIYSYLALCYKGLADYEMALRFIDKAIEKKDIGDYHLTKADFLLQLGKYREAEKEIISSKIRNKETFLMLLKIYREEGDQEAIERLLNSYKDYGLKEEDKESIIMEMER